MWFSNTRCCLFEPNFIFSRSLSSCVTIDTVLVSSTWHARDSRKLVVGTSRTCHTGTKYLLSTHHLTHTKNYHTAWTRRNLLAPWYTVYFEQLTIINLVIIFRLYGNQVNSKAHKSYHWTSWIQLTSDSHKIHFNPLTALPWLHWFVWSTCCALPCSGHPAL
jgi:hypothetical protein